MAFLTWSQFFGDPYLFLFLKFVALVFKAVLLVMLNIGPRATKIRPEGLRFLSYILAATLLVDLFSVISTLGALDFFFLTNFVRLMFVRANWILNIVFQMCLAIFVENLLSRKRARFFVFSRLFWAIALCVAFTASVILSPSSHVPYEFLLRGVAYLFILTTGLHTIFSALYVIRNSLLPRLLKHQARIFITAFIVPQLFAKCLTYNPFTGIALCDSYYAFANLSNAIFTFAMCYCTFRLMGLRFLNTRDHITLSRRFNFISLMKEVWVQLNSIAHPAEFRHVTQQVFSMAFQLPNGSARLVLTQDENYLVSDEQIQLLQTSLAPDRPLARLLADTKVITRDEIDFSAYYDQDPAYAQAADFLRKLDADVFIPIYDRNNILGCIIVNEGARPQKFYSCSEQDEMAVFAASLSSIITLVKNRNIDYLLARKNSIETELYHRHRELAQYQESIRSFLRHSHERKIGLLYYKYNAFTFGNQAAHDFITCDLNLQRGHPLVIELRKIAQNTEKYATAQSTTICIDTEQRLAVSSFPSLERQSTVLVVSHPDMADVIKMQADLLRDPGQWNYLLYLETTEAGRLVRELIPGGSKTLLNFKIDLLRAALSHRAILLNARTDDRQSLIDLLQTTSQRQQMQTITLKEPEKDLTVARQLFGFAKILGTPQEQPPLLERFDKTGTIYLENVHFLSRETQLHLAEFLRFGAFTPIKGDQRVPADVRIICSSTESLHMHVEAGTFLPELLDELRAHMLVLPQPGSLDRAEFEQLVGEYMQQLLNNHALKKILSLSEREVNVLFTEKCPSFAELKRRLSVLISTKAAKREQSMQQALSVESKETKASGEIAKTSSSITDQDALLIASDERINQAVLLGKKALKNRDLMAHLWKIFQNQARIATLLGVNRSSVNRRFKHLQID